MTNVEAQGPKKTDERSPPRVSLVLVRRRETAVSADHRNAEKR